jgi:hypothetical protein
MLRSIPSRLILSFLLAAFALPLAVVAQSQDTESVADAARRAREQKKSLPKAAKVVTEDDIPARLPEPVAQPAAAQLDAAQPGTAQPAGATADKPGAPTAKDKDKKAKAAEDAELAALKEAVVKAQKETDISKRDLALDQDTYLSTPDFEHDTAGKAKLDELRQLFADKQQSLEQVKEKLAAFIADHPNTPASNSANNPDQPATPPDSAPQP